MLKILFFLVFLTQKLAPSNVLNGIIFTIDEQCNLIFETTLFTNCKPYIIFLFSGAHFLFFFVFLISVPCFTISLLSLSPSARRLYLPLRQNSCQSIKPTYSLISFSFFFFIHSMLFLYSIFLFPLSLLSSLFSLCASPMSGLRQWLCFDDCGMPMAVVWWRWWRFLLLLFFFFWFCVVLLGSNWAPIMWGQHKTTCYQIFDSILGLDLIYRCEGGRQAVPWKKMTMEREVVSVFCGFWFRVMGLLMGLLVVAMVEISFLFFLFFCCGWWWWVDVVMSFCCDFFFFFC